MGEIIESGDKGGNDNVIPFKRPDKTNIEVHDVLDESSGYGWSKDNIIGALLCNGTLDIVGDPINYLLAEEYDFLYEKLIDFICSMGELYYDESGYIFKYNKQEKVVYMVDNATIRSNESYKLDIYLLTNDDSSMTTVEVRYKDNIMLILSDQLSAMTGYIPFEDFEL